MLEKNKVIGNVSHFPVNRGSHDAVLRQLLF